MVRHPEKVFRRPVVEPTPPIDIKVAMSKLFTQKKSESMIRKLAGQKLGSLAKKPTKSNADIKIDPTVKIDYPVPHVYNDGVDENFIFKQRQKIIKIHEAQA